MRAANTKILRGLSALFSVAIALSACTGGPSGIEILTQADSSRVTPDKAGFNPYQPVSEAYSPEREVIKNPTIAEITETGPLGEMSWGRADASVTIVQYASMSCPHCRRFHMEVYPQFKKEFIDTGKVRYILREFPIGKASGTATIALRCAPHDKYMDLYGRFMEQQGAWVSQAVRTDEIMKVAAQVGISGEQFQACLNDKAMVAKLTAIKDRGRKLGVIGTPNYFINGKLVKSEIGLGDIRIAVMAAENRSMPRAVASSATKVD
jgi:protein-disulfide isomerase